MTLGLNALSDFKKLPVKKNAILLCLILLTAFLGILYPSILTADPRVSSALSRTYRVGELADADVVSPVAHSFIDEVATEQEVSKAAESILPQFSYSVSQSIRIESRASRFREAAESGNLAAFFEEEGIADIHSITPRLEALDGDELQFVLDLALECLQGLIVRGIFQSGDILTAESGGYSSIDIENSSIAFMYAGSRFSTSDAIVIEGAKEFATSWVSDIYPSLVSGDADIISDIVATLASSNVFYDEVLTVSLRNEAASNVPPVVVQLQEGDVIIKADTVVTDRQVRIIEELKASAQVNIPVLIIIGEVAFVVVFLILVLCLIFSFIKYEYRLFLYVSMFLIGADIYFTVSFFMIRALSAEGLSYIDPFLPISILPLLAMTVTGRRRMGFAVGLLTAGLTVLYPMCGVYSFFYLIAVSECCLIFFHVGHQRVYVIYQAVVAALLVAVITLLFSMLSNQGYFAIIANVLVSMVNTVIAFIFLSIIVPILEKLFNIPTEYRLHELSYTDTPTLNRLSQVAPGTFNHSKNVSEMAYYACKAIGANADLALVGGLYHDIGKAEHPEYFIENQTGRNAHDEINKTLSAAIIKSHVKLGVEKAKEAGLPQEVIDIIGEHHGNDLIKYFYNEAIREAKERSQIVSEEDFRYNGKIPSTPESAVVMLADCTEAATRTIKNPNHQKYDKFISSITMDKINYGQLSNSGLTIDDLFIIKDAFIHYLMGRDHQRIEYGSSNN